MTTQCDIIIPVWNEMEMTRDCFESLSKFTNISYRVIAIDNGSDESTKKYLQNASALFPFYKLIRFEENKGFVKATNQGLRESSSEFVCLLNNDTILTRGWLSEMISVMRDTAVGAVYPQSNECRKLPRADIHVLAESLSSEKGKWRETDVCIGFCMLIRKRALDEVGFLDETYGLGYFEEMDLCRRLQSRGYLCAQSMAAYVYHLGGESFKNIAKPNLLLQKNAKIFFKKWGGAPLQIAFIDDGTLDVTELKNMSQSLLAACRDHNVVTLFHKKTQPVPLPDHTSLRPYGLGKILFGWEVFFRILAREFKRNKNKNYALIIGKRSFLLNFLKIIGFLWGFSVIDDFNESSGQKAWRMLSMLQR